MPRLHNSITIEAPLEAIWDHLASVDRLAQYDPAVEASVSLSESNSGKGAKRRVEMKDGKNWFEEECTIYRENEELGYELTACSFPVQNLSHRYRFKEVGPNKYEVSQIQEFRMKYGILGQFLGLMIKPRWNNGIKMFLKGLKEIAER